MSKSANLESCII